MKVKAKKRFTLLMSLLLLSWWLPAQASKNLLGEWQDIDHPEKQLAIYEHSDGKLYGKVINDQRKKSKNGYLVLRELQWDESAKGYTGTLSSPDMNLGKLPVLVLMNGPDQFSFRVKALLSSRTLRFTRMK